MFLWKVAAGFSTLASRLARNLIGEGEVRFVWNGKKNSFVFEVLRSEATLVWFRFGFEVGWCPDLLGINVQ